MNNNRKHWIDIAKGIAIILMVVGHTSIPNVASNFIYAFHMPLFFIASGFVSNYGKHTIWKYIKHKFYAIMLPFLTYSTVVALLLYCIGMLDIDHLIKNGWEGYALWFIPVLFLASILAMLISRIEKDFTRFCAMLCLLLLGCDMSYYGISLPWTLSTVPYATFLILLGTGLKNYQKQLELQGHYFEILLLFIITLIISQLERLDLAWNDVTPSLPLVIGAVAGTLMVFRLSVWVEQHAKRFALILQTIGRETYVVVAFSQIIIMCINHFFTLPTPLKYILLIILLILSKYAKDGINQLVKFKIL